MRPPASNANDRKETEIMEVFVLLRNNEIVGVYGDAETAKADRDSFIKTFTKDTFEIRVYEVISK